MFRMSPAPPSGRMEIRSFCSAIWVGSSAAANISPPFMERSSVPRPAAMSSARSSQSTFCSRRYARASSPPPTTAATAGSVSRWQSAVLRTAKLSAEPRSISPAAVTCPTGPSSLVRVRADSWYRAPLRSGSLRSRARRACPVLRSAACAATLKHSTLSCQRSRCKVRLAASAARTTTRFHPSCRGLRSTRRSTSCHRWRPTKMCGIVGIYGHENAAAMAHLGLYSLQHRGQESSGIVAVDRERGAKAIKSMGLVSEALSANAVEGLPGDIAIGHTRYSTAGSSTIDNAQPMLARFRDGHIALAHNGNLTNASELRRELENGGSIFTSTMDSEVLVHRMARSFAEKPEQQLADALQGVEGAYCLVVVVGNTLLAARDPSGWRPLVIGKVGDTTVFASETCALDLLGATLLREVERGEIIAVDRDGMRSSFPMEKL